MLTVRKMVLIDEEKCDGCGVCVPSCAEGALRIINGKAKLISDSFCDGLGACLGECPQGAITIEDRAAVPFDEEAVTEHLKSILEETMTSEPEPSACGCPGSAMRTIDRGQGQAVKHAQKNDSSNTGPIESSLVNWPVQLMLVNPMAPYLQGADILIAADCVPFAYPEFHQKFLKGRVVLIGCPKLDDIQHYRVKLEEIFKVAQPNSVTVLRMEVPCCTGIAVAAKEALDAAVPGTPFGSKIIGIQGDIKPG